VTARVGVLGAGGEVGRATARRLQAAGLAELRLGARPGLAPRSPVLGPESAAEVMLADAADRETLDRFCSGCRVVVNCTASTSTRELVASAAMAAGADYLDPAGDGQLLSRVSEVCRAHPGRTALLAAGASPGLTGLLPRWLALQGFDRLLALTGYAFAMDRFSPGSAADFLLSLGGDEGAARAAWRGETRVSQAPGRLPRVVLPFFAPPLAAFPYLSAETEAVARSLGLREVRWYNVFEADGQMYGALPRLRESLARGAELAEVAAELARVAEHDLFGRRPLHQVVLQLDGEAAGRSLSRVAVLTASGTYELTAAVVALGVEALLGSSLPAGAGFAADMLDPSGVERLRGSPAVRGLHALEGPIEVYAQVEQGAL
jgi:Saccharopine dehydrogenase NADP binding domain